MMINGELVIPTKQLAKLYGLPQGKLYQNFLRHKTVFQEGLHYHVLSGREMEVLKTSYPELKRNNMMYVWTAYGAYLHAQFLKGAQVWKGYCQCIYYFFSESPSVNASLQILQETVKKLEVPLKKEGAFEL